MNLAIDRARGIPIVRIGEPKLMYPMLSDFTHSVSELLASGESRVVIDMTQVKYLDSASIGCLMDLYRRTSQAGGGLRLVGVQKRVETMLTMTGTNNFIGLHASESDALSSFGE